MSIEDAKKKYTDPEFAKNIAAEKYNTHQSLPNDKFDPMSALLGMVCGLIAGVMLVWIYTKVIAKRRN